MIQNNLAELADAVGRIEVISTDVFDTLLLRTSRSERARILRGERLFSNLLARRGLHITSDLLADVRLQAQRLAFRGLALRGVPGEVRLDEIVGRQLSVLGLPQSLVTERLRIEVEVEKSSLVANKYLAGILQAHRRAGARIDPERIYVQTGDPGPNRIVLGEKALPPIRPEEAPRECHPTQRQQCLQVELVLFDTRGLHVDVSCELRQPDAGWDKV